MRVGRGEVVWELHGLTAKLTKVSALAAELRRGGFDGGLSSPAFKVERRRVLVCGNAEQAKERVEWLAGAFVRLMRALGEGGGLSLGRATATARWRPCGGSGRRGEGGGTSARQRAVEEEQRDAWALARSRTWAETEQRS